MNVSSETLYFSDCFQLVCRMVTVKLLQKFEYNAPRKNRVYEKYVFNLRHENKIKLWML